MFVEGQKVKITGWDEPGTVLSGPHRSPTNTMRWLVEKSDGVVDLHSERFLSAVDDRREIVAQAIYSKLRGGVWGCENEMIRTNYLEAAGAVLSALDKPSPLAAGDKIRILQKDLGFADVRVGAVYVVSNPDKYGDGKFMTVHAPERTDDFKYWSFSRDTEGTGWERV